MVGNNSRKNSGWNEMDAEINCKNCGWKGKDSEAPYDSDACETTCPKCGEEIESENPYVLKSVVLALIDAKIAEVEKSEKENGREGFERMVRAKPLLRELREEIVGLEGERPSCAEVEGLK
jgi:predicted RNA-binding Zn-ribbon protein involved in translation (DUF1610 family)